MSGLNGVRSSAQSACAIARRTYELRNTAPASVADFGEVQVRGERSGTKTPRPGRRNVEPRRWFRPNCRQILRETASRSPLQLLGQLLVCSDRALLARLGRWGRVSSVALRYFAGRNRAKPIPLFHNCGDYVNS